MSPGDLPLSCRLDRIDAKLDQVLIDVAVLKERDRLRSVLWGGGSGLAIALIAAALQAILA